MIVIGIDDQRSFNATVMHLNSMQVNGDRELAIAVNYTAKAHQRAIADKIREKVNIKLAAIKKLIKIGQRATTGNPTAVIELRKSHRPNLSAFGARQTAAGVTYKIRKDGGRKLLAGAFGPEINKLGRQVYVRVPGQVHRTNKPDNRKMFKPRGVSAFGVYVKNHMNVWSKAEIEKRLHYELQRRIRAILVNRGAIVDTRSVTP